ncbi:Shedu immune nuclease family protein [Dyella sp. 20L07]|uniref:Shedu immune nuclease family protein n=1 Tax=Dyella sp. 20L07 TaxID=3384240 RepID=UPI003D2C94DC
MSSLRPGEYRRSARIALGLAPEPNLLFVPRDDGAMQVYLSDSEMEPMDALELGQALLLANVLPNGIMLFPRQMNPDSSDYLQPKYGALFTITVAAPVAKPYHLPSDEDEFEVLLDSLPAGFSRDYRSGLGLNWELRFICTSVAQIAGVTGLVVHGGTGANDARIDGATYYLGIDRFRRLIDSIRHTSRRYQRESLSERRGLAHNELLHSADPESFPERIGAKQTGAIAKFASQRSPSAAMNKRDRAAALKLVKESTTTLATEEPRTLFQLKREIELITLADLICRFEDMLQKDLSEGRWQRFLQDNPFVLSLAFAVPTMMIGGGTYVGGMTAYRFGGKIADFLMATASTGNLAVVEIKTPSSALLGNVPYRTGVYAPSSELSGALAQTLDQRAQLQAEWMALCVRSGLADKHGYAITGVVLIGRTPGDINQRKSFDLVRNAVSGVSIVTFDELLLRLKEILTVLSPPPRTTIEEDVPF